MDIISISTAITSIKTATEILSTILNISKDTHLNEKIIELNGIIIDLQSQIFKIRDEQNELIKIKSDIENKLIEYENWEKTKSQYELKQIAPGIFVYSMKKDIESTEPEHWLCTRCYDIDHKKSILIHDKTTLYDEIYICSQCNNKINLPVKEGQKPYFKAIIH